MDGRAARKRRRRALIWAIAGSAILLLSIAVFNALSSEGITGAFMLGFTLLAGLFTLALTLALRVPDNAVTWTLLMATWGAIVYQSSFDFLDLAERFGWPGTRLVFALGNTIFWVQMVLGIVILPLIFPTGTAPGPRWRWFAWMAALGIPPQSARAFYLAFTLPPEALEDGATGLVPLDGAVAAGQTLIVLAALGAVVSLGARFWRSNGVERLQIKWLLFPLSVLVLFWLVESILGSGLLSNLLLIIGGISLPIALSVAVLRYRLYEIDRIVSRTVSYTVVVGVLLAVYAAVVGVMTRLLPVESDLSVAAATLGVAALFNPIRRRVQGFVDRRFNRTRYVAGRELETIAPRLGASTDVAVITGDVIGVVERTLEPFMAHLWIRSRLD